MTDYAGTNSNCFACGINNDKGLKLRFAKLDDYVETVWTVPDHFQGWDNLTHGGIISTILDETMSHAIFKLLGENVVTGEFTVRFVKPLFVGTTIIARGYIEQDKGRLVEARSEIHDTKGNLIAKSTGRFVRIANEQKLEYK